MEIILAIIVLSGLLGSMNSNKNKAAQGRQRQYEKSDQSSGNNRSEGVEDAWGQLKRRIEEAAGGSAESVRRTSSYARSDAHNPSRSAGERGGSSPRHRRITADTGERKGNLIRERIDESRNATSVATRKAEIAESIAYWEANRAHMRAINKDFNDFIDHQHRKMHQGMKNFRAGTNR